MEAFFWPLAKNLTLFSRPRELTVLKTIKCFRQVIYLLIPVNLKDVFIVVYLKTFYVVHKSCFVL